MVPPPLLPPLPEREGLLTPESHVREGRSPDCRSIVLELVRGATMRPGRVLVDRSLLKEGLREGSVSRSPAGFRIMRGALGAVVL